MPDFPTLVQGDSGCPTLVCLPYFGGSARSFSALWPLLPASWNLRAYTLKNVGVEDGRYSLPVAFEQLARAIRRDVRGPFHLVGHSMGGKIALGAASLGLEGLEGIVLLAPSPPSPEPMSEESRTAMLRRHGTREGALETVRLASARALLPEQLEIAIEDDLAMSESDWYNWLQIGSREDSSEILSRVRVPVKILVGEKDEGMTPDLMMRTIIEPLRAVGALETELQVIEGSGHLLPFEAPQKVAHWLRAWIV
ncbi:2-succinyl-6-hydroxy-2,4-cyclohexadiene-1-carboxylate synthase [Abditibacteriota bacterium]|nr:2-succinyl-6-hydroxy-2,4-cyclohexadiene-1-carboxylate synthase [Abditibacteriota bacterium]